jgi:actin-related protein
MELLRPKIEFTTTFEREFARDIKEQCCYVQVGDGDLQRPEKKRYQLPDGKVVDLTHEQSQAPEVLFNTSLIGRDEGSSL